MSEEDFRVHFPENRSLFSFYTLKKVLKALFALAVIALLVFVFARNHTMKGRKEMREFLWTEEAIGAAKDKDFKIYEIPAYSEPSVNATFSISNIYYTEPLNQFQFLLSYNLSKLEYWAEDKGLETVPEKGEDLFAFVLADSSGNYYTEYEFVTDKLLFNGFFRLVFTDVEMTENVYVGSVPIETGDNPATETITAVVPISTFTLYVYYKGDVDFEGEKLDEISVFDVRYAREEVTFAVPDTARSDIRNDVVTESPGKAGRPKEIEAENETDKKTGEEPEAETGTGTGEEQANT